MRWTLVLAVGVVEGVREGITTSLRVDNPRKYFSEMWVVECLCGSGWLKREDNDR